MHHHTCGISSLLRPVNLILFTLLLVHLILRISPPLLSPSITPSAFLCGLKTQSSVSQILSSVVFLVPFGLGTWTGLSWHRRLF